MDVAVSNAVSTALYMNQAQSAEQAQMQLFKQSLDMQGTGNVGSACLC